MSCSPMCPVPNFLLPKGMRKKQIKNCIEINCPRQCTGYGVYPVVPRGGKCIRDPELAKLMRCSACQEERIKRLIGQRKNHYQCWLQSHIRGCPEIPFLWKPERAKIRFIRHGYTVQDCMPRDVLKNPCVERAAWKKKVKKWIKCLDEHYNTKIANASEKPIEDYIRLYLSNLCTSCEALERQKIGQDEGFDPESEKKKKSQYCKKVQIICGCSNNQVKPRH